MTHLKSIRNLLQDTLVLFLKDFLENADRCCDLTGDNYICANCIHKFRKKNGINRLVYAVYISIALSKAFDKVWHEGL